MNETIDFGLVVMLVAGAGLLAIAAIRIAFIVRIPPPALMLVVAAVAANVIDPLNPPDHRSVERLVSVALVFILFDGGTHIGWSRLRPVLVPVGTVGILGTFGTAALASVFIVGITDLTWYQGLLLATAIAPTDPAIVFAVLGNKGMTGNSSTVLEGESGANDPVGIALMIGLIGAGELSSHALGEAAGEFCREIAIGAALGIIGGWIIGRLLRTRLPNTGLYPLRSSLCALMLFGVTSYAHGSGFLAVFVAGIYLGDRRLSFHDEIRRFQGALAGLGEIVAFIVLGLTVDLDVVRRPDVWGPGLALALALVFVIRPVAVGLCLTGSGLNGRERLFVLFAGLKGAVPILLGALIVGGDVPGAERLYGIVVVVVMFSIVFQAGLVPAITARLALRSRTSNPASCPRHD